MAKWDHLGSDKASFVTPNKIDFSQNMENQDVMCSNPFKNKHAFITGSSRGIGRAMALALAEHGCHILLHYRKNEEEARRTLEEVKGKGVKSWLYRADLCDTEQTKSMLNEITKEHDSLDFYIANAASTSFKSLLDLNLNNVDLTFSLVIKNFIQCVQKLRPLLKGRDSQILTISGIDTVKYCPGHGLLAAAKSALETLTKYLSVELASDQIHTKCLNPGLVTTDSTRFYMGDAFEKICEGTNKLAPHGGFSTPEDLAQLALIFLRPETNWIATKTIHADGGLSFILPGFG